MSPSLIIGVTWIAETSQGVSRCGRVFSHSRGEESRQLNGYQGFKSIPGHRDTLTGMGNEVTQRQLNANEQASQSALGQCHALVDWWTGAGHKEPELCGSAGMGRVGQTAAAAQRNCVDPLALVSAVAAANANK